VSLWLFPSVIGLTLNQVFQKIIFFRIFNKRNLKPSTLIQVVRTSVFLWLGGVRVESFFPKGFPVFPCPNGVYEWAVSLGSDVVSSEVGSCGCGAWTGIGMLKTVVPVSAWMRSSGRALARSASSREPLTLRTSMGKVPTRLPPPPHSLGQS